MYESPFLSLSSYLFIYILRYRSKLQFKNVERQIFLTNMFSSWKNIFLLSFLISRVVSACFKENIVPNNECYIFRSSELSRYVQVSHCNDYAWYINAIEV